MDGWIAAVDDKRFIRRTDRVTEGFMKGWREAKMNKWKEEEEGRYNFEKSERKGRNGKLLNTTINYLHFSQKILQLLSDLRKGWSHQRIFFPTRTHEFISKKFNTVLANIVLQLILSTSELTIPSVERGAKRGFWTHDNDHQKDHILAECDIWFEVQIVKSRLIQCIVLIFNEKYWVSADLARLCSKGKTLFNYF